MCSLGIIKKLQEKQWLGLTHPGNKAAIYGLPKDVDYQGCRTPPLGERESIYTTDSPPIFDVTNTGIIFENERFNRVRTPQYDSSG